MLPRLNVFDDGPNSLSPLFQDGSGSFQDGRFELGFLEAISQIIHLFPRSRFLYSMFTYDSLRCWSVSFKNTAILPHCVPLC